MSKRFDLLSVGEMLIDFTPGEGEGVYVRNPGGAPINLAIAFSRLGGSSAFCGKLGDDDFGRFLLDVQRAHGVEPVCPLLTREAITTLAFVSLNDSGERSFTFARKPGADMLLTEEDVDKAGLENATIVHAGSLSLSGGPAAAATRHALEKARELGKIVSFDVNYRDLIWEGDYGRASEKIRETLRCIDIIKISDEEAFLFGSEDDCVSLFSEHGIRVVVITRGARGASAFLDGVRADAAKSPPAKVVDTTGAGDAFFGGFLSSIVSDGISQINDITIETVEKALLVGSAAGWLTVQKAGAINALPSMEEVRAAMALFKP
ncbi:MAG: carbohydrate kinase [Clostridiales Family XIII bacterium]|jgi:sugar/nucleoside kinase (ribokinase family)|nr:carbohydrate kinase [Clostridiales Family XIII bacterium]